MLECQNIRMVMGFHLTFPPNHFITVLYSFSSCVLNLPGHGDAEGLRQTDPHSLTIHHGSLFPVIANKVKRSAIGRSED